MRDHVLEERAWTFATSRATLLPDATPPAFGYGQRFLIPSEWLRVLEVSDKATDPAQSASAIPFQWNIENGYILGNAEKIYVKYVKTVSSTALFSADFTDCLAYRLAAEMAISLTESNTVFTNMYALYEDKLIKAGVKDGAQGRRQEKYLGSYVLRR
jgi:hypothetical protein